MLTLRDLFQVVFEMKKKEVEEVKRQKELAAGQHGNTGNTVSLRERQAVGYHEQ